MIVNGGLWSFNMPSLAAGDYLLRGEIIALHSAGSQGQAQFYMSCAAIRVTGSGTCAPTDTVSFPGAYSATDPGILISIYGNTGKPDNGGKAYAIPGPKVASCGTSSGSPATSKPASSSTKTSAVPSTFSTSTTVRSTVTQGSSNGNSNPTTSSVVPTTKPSNMNTVAPSTSIAATTSAADKGDSGPGTTATSPASSSSTGYPMTGPGGKKFVCYEVTDF